METLGYFGWWVIPLALFGLMAVACIVMGSRRGCGCAGPRCARRESPRTPGA